MISSDAKTPEGLLSDLLTYIEKAERLLQAGHMAELAGLNNVVDILCGKVLDMPAADSKEYAPELEHLNQRLSDLQQAMMATQKMMEENIDALDKRQRAAKAYLTTPHLVKPEE